MQGYESESERVRERVSQRVSSTAAVVLILTLHMLVKLQTQDSIHLHTSQLECIKHRRIGVFAITLVTS
jgi:hypothetical protein